MKERQVGASEREQKRIQRTQLPLDVSDTPESVHTGVRARTLCF